MIKAEHKYWARFIFNIYINRLLKKNFSSFYIVNEPPSIDDNKALLVTPNHISWWDGFFIDYIARTYIPRTIHLMMLEEQLQKYKFFGKVGAYSIVPDNSASIKETTHYTKEILRDRRNFVVTYPQGSIEAFDKKQLTIKEGIKLFTAEEPEQTVILPVGFRIQYYNQRHPAVICRFGDTVNAADMRKDFPAYTEPFTNNLAALKEAAHNKNFIRDLFT